MAPASADAAIGMMDSAYFISRKELLDFFNNLLNLRLTKIEQTASGAVACQIADLVFPGSIPMSKINWQARSDYEFVQNYKLLQAAFAKFHVQKFVDVTKLIRAKYQDNLEFCQWLKAFFETSNVMIPDNYDPVAARSKGKGGAQFNAGPMGSGNSGSFTATTSSRSIGSQPGVRSTVTRPGVSLPTSSPARRPISAVSRAGRTPTTASSPVKAASPARGLGARPAVRARNPAIGTSSTVPSAATDNTIADLRQQLDAALDAQGTAESQLAQAQAGQAELELKVVDLETAVLDIEKERDFYFEKLRHVEVLLQVYQESTTNATNNSNNDDDENNGETKNSERMIEDVFKILYATAEENVVVSDDGRVEMGGEEGGGDDVNDTSAMGESVPVSPSGTYDEDDKLFDL